MADSHDSTPLRIYLDSNVYSYAVEQEEVRQLAEYFCNIPSAVFVSDIVMIELGRVPNVAERRARAFAVRSIGRKYMDPPFAYREAMELLEQIRQHRPEWLLAKPNTKSIDEFIHFHRRRWKKFRNDFGFDPAQGIPQYLETAGSTDSLILRSQRKMREISLNSRSVEFQSPVPAVQEMLEPLEQPERHWRIASMGVWTRALEGFPAMRDYRDYLLPYLESSFDVSDWGEFWSMEVTPTSMPISRLHAAIEYRQLEAKISHGNVLDTQHGVCVLDCDVLLTCDRNFAKVLNLALSDLPASVARGKVGLVARTAHRSSLDAIREVLDQLVESR